MTYTGLNSDIAYEVASNGKIHLHSIKRKPIFRDLSFGVLEPGTWQTQNLLKILYGKAGGIIESVVFRSRFKHPIDDVLRQQYRITFKELAVEPDGQIQKMGLAFPKKNLNSLMAEIEEEIEKTLPVKFYSHHRYRVENEY